MSNICVLDLFEQPPMELLLSHMDDVYQCVSLLPGFLAAVMQGDWQAAEEIYLEVVEIEHKADQKKYGLRLLLRKDLILQLSKRDLLQAILEQDKIANVARDVCGLLLWRREKFPNITEKILIDYAKTISKTCSFAKSCLEMLATLVDSVFTKESKSLLDDNLTLLEEAESVTDDLQCEIRSLLLSEETNFSSVQMICFYDIVNKMGSIADLAESYGHLLFVCVSD